MATVILLCGLPGSGKTTIARRLAAERPAVRLCPDEWMAALAIDLFDQDARGRVEALQWTLAQELVQLGQTVVIEWGVWARSERDTVREWCRERGVGVELHFLDVPLPLLQERIARRNESPSGATPRLDLDDIARWAELFQAPTVDELGLFDPPR